MGYHISFLHFGISMIDGRPAGSRIYEAFKWTLFIVVLALIISLLISIPLSFVAMMYKNKWPDRLVQNASYL